MPIEVMAKRGIKTMLYGPMKQSVWSTQTTIRGLVWMANSKPLMQLSSFVRIMAGSLYNIVGFRDPPQNGRTKRVFQVIPGLENAEFVRYGVMANSYMDSPKSS